MKNVLQPLPECTDQQSIPAEEAGSETWLRSLQSSIRFGVKEAALAAILVLSPGCKCADDPYDSGREFIMDTYSDSEKRRQDIEQAAETAEVIWTEMWDSVVFLQEGYTQYKDMDQDEILSNAAEFKAFVEQSDKHLGKITDAASKLRAKGIRVNPGVIQYPLELIDKLQKKIRSANRNRRAIKGLAYLGEWVDWDITKKARAGENVLQSVDGAASELLHLKLTLESLIERRLKTEVNNATITLAIKAYKDTETYRNSDISLEMEHPPRIPVGLGKGENGPEVALLQSYLIDMGYLLPGCDDGNFDTKTEKALIKFNQDAKVFSPGYDTPDERLQKQDPLRGTVQEGTLEKLKDIDEALEEKPCKSMGGLKLRDGLRGPDVENLQQRLIELGKLREGKDDGEFGAGTKNALTSFQTECLTWVKREGGLDLLKPSQRGRVDMATCRSLERPEKFCSDAFLEKRELVREK